MGQGYLIDTNAIIDFLGSRLPLSGQEKMLTIDPVVSVITAIELFSSNKITMQDEEQLHLFLKAAKIFDVIDADIVSAAINIRKKYKTKTPDAIIAATAIVHGLTLLTANTKDFSNITGLSCLNPWEI